MYYQCPNCNSTCADIAANGTAIDCPLCQHKFVIAVPGDDSPLSVAAPASTTANSRFSDTTILQFLDDIFDFRFKRFLTPLLIKVLWAGFILAMLLFLVLSTYSGFIDLFESRPRGVDLLEYERASGRRVLNWCYITVLKIISVLTAIIFVRIVCECCIVVFNIASHLRDIKKKLGNKT